MMITSPGLAPLIADWSDEMLLTLMVAAEAARAANTPSSARPGRRSDVFRFMGGGKRKRRRSARGVPRHAGGRVSGVVVGAGRERPNARGSRACKKAARARTLVMLTSLNAGEDAHACQHQCHGSYPMPWR